jgi:hypothetical protein
MNLKVCARRGILIGCLLAQPSALAADSLTTWTLQTSGVTNALICVAAGNGRFVAAGLDGTLIHSSNAINWARAELPTSVTELSGNPFQRVRFLNGRFVALHWGYADTNFITQILTSPDGVNWSTRYRTNFGRTVAILYDVAYGNGLYVAVGPNWRVTSTNGIDWTRYGYPAQPGSLGTLYSIAFGRGQFHAVGVNTVRASIDGVTWTNLSGGIFSRNDLVYGGGVFLHTAWQTGLFPSPYYLVPLNYPSPGEVGPLARRPGGIAYADGVFVAVGERGLFLTAPLEGPWTERTSTVTNNLYEVCYANGIFVGVGSDGAIATSGDIRPRLKLKRTSPQPDAPLCVSVECVVGTRYELEWSSDLLSWTSVARFTNTTGLVEICDPVAIGSGQRFYRTKSLSP